jgi:hypothetical protein
MDHRTAYFSVAVVRLRFRTQHVGKPEIRPGLRFVAKPGFSTIMPATLLSTERHRPVGIRRLAHERPKPFVAHLTVERPTGIFAVTAPNLSLYRRLVGPGVVTEPPKINALDTRTPRFASARRINVPLTIVAHRVPRVRPRNQQIPPRFRAKAATREIRMPTSPNIHAFIPPEIADHERINHHRKRHAPLKVHMRRQSVPIHRVGHRQRRAVRLDRVSRRNRIEDLAFLDDFHTPWHLLAQLQRRPGWQRLALRHASTTATRSTTSRRTSRNRSTRNGEAHAPQPSMTRPASHR